MKEDRVIAQIDDWILLCDLVGLTLIHKCPTTWRDSAVRVYPDSPTFWHCHLCGASRPKSLQGIIDLARMAMK